MLICIVIIINIIKGRCYCAAFYAANYLLNVLQMECDLPYPVKEGRLSVKHVHPTCLTLTYVKIIKVNLFKIIK